MLVVSWIFWIVPAAHCTSGMCLGIQKTEDANKSPLCNNTILCESKPLIKICVVLKNCKKTYLKNPKKKRKKEKKTDTQNDKTIYTIYRLTIVPFSFTDSCSIDLAFESKAWLITQNILNKKYTDYCKLLQ